MTDSDTDTALLHGHSLIAGERIGPATAFAAEDPRSGAELPGRFHEAGPDDAARAAELAAEAFAAGSSQAQRIALLEEAARGIEQLGDALLERTSAETALPMPRLQGERARTVGQLRLFAELLRSGDWQEAIIDPALPERRPQPRPDLRSLLVPLGPVAVFGAANFPFAFSVAGGDSAAALAAGCPVVVKAHPGHPGCSELVGEALAAAVRTVGLHPGWFSLLQGRGHACGQALVRHPAIRAGAFTGSLAGGRALFDLACARPEPIPFHAEMGSANPVFVLRGCGDPMELGRGLAASVCLGVGQFCTRPGLILVVASEAEALLAGLDAVITAQPAGTLLHRGIAERYRADLARLDGHAAVAAVARGGSGEGPCTAQATLYRCSAGALASHPGLWEERFGPTTLVAVADDIEELLAAAHSMPGSLTATVHGAADASARRLLDLLVHRAGRLLWGGVPTGVEVCAAMMHGGPYPASTDSRASSVGSTAIARFLRRVCYQDLPDDLLPEMLRRSGPA